MKKQEKDIRISKNNFLYRGTSIKKCEYCNDQFTSLKNKTRFCSIKCANRSRRPKYELNCNVCNKKLIYKSPQSFCSAKNGNKLCRSCSSKEKFSRLEVKEKIKNALTGRKLSEKTKEKMRGSNNGMYGKDGYWKGKKFSKYVINKMKATHAGFSSYEEYKKKYPIKKQYKSKVWSETYRQIRKYKLKNFEKRGRCGVKGAYQIDHIIGIEEGFYKNISPKIIGNIKNLKMIPWEKNLNKYWKRKQKMIMEIKQ